MSKKEKEIKHLMEKLGISQKEAEDLYDFDHKTDAQQKEELEFFGIEDTKAKTKKTKDAKEPKKSSPIAKVKTMKKKAQLEENKEEIKQAFVEWLESASCIVNPQEIKGGQYCFMDKDGNFYSFKLTKHKTIQDGYTL